MVKTKEQDYLTRNIIAKVVSFIAEDQRITIEQAMALFFTSQLSKKIEDIETGYYLESPAYIYEIFKEELGEVYVRLD